MSSSTVSVSVVAFDLRLGFCRAFSDFAWGFAALAPAVAARTEFRQWLGDARLLRHEANFAHVLGRDVAVEDLFLL